MSARNATISLVMRVLLSLPVILVLAMPAAALTPPDVLRAAIAEAGEADEPVEPVTVTLAAIGDVMMHDLQVRTARGEDGRYRVEGGFDPVMPYLAGADLAVANLETPLGGEDMAYSGYPTFNAPRALAGALAGAGVDVVQTANNHCMDRREKGLLRTLDALDAEGLLHVGTRADPTGDPTLWLDVKGLRVALLAYTFSTNGIPLPPGREGIVSQIDAERMEAEIAAAREDRADLVVVLAHWGFEYRDKPEAETVVLAQQLVEAGADLVLGGHPHWIQPYEILTAADGHEGFVIYSLGNFYTNMRKRYQDAGMVLRLTLEGVPGLGVSLVDVGYLPTWLDITDETGATHHQAIDIGAVLSSCEAQPRLDAADCARMQQVLDDTTGLLGTGDLIDSSPSPEITDPSGGTEAVRP
jgi:poly-gamma-glutamate capsule biosynthesis protein CapA/YwtB (metallophosphatase superfamily)